MIHKLFGVAILAGLITAPAHAELDQRQRLAELMEQHGAKGELMYESVIRYADRCNNQGKELAVLLYMGASPEGEKLTEALFKAANKAERAALIDAADCPI